ncbi:ArsR/SmtB family transcription factor [Pseudarthrobacter sp. J1738]|uniref:ArsR/SmtB family transcription factor n=1 Tax=Pseudarthrobacter sp. J1738 TaxID=3420446 RepID=UPI003D29C39B
MTKSSVPTGAPARRAAKIVEISDPQAIRALAHGARLRVISELYSTQVSRTATELAVYTGLTPSAMSYHLRALKKWGMVVPAQSDGDARERRWRAAGTDFVIKSVSGAGHPEMAIFDLELDEHRRRVVGFTKARDESRGAADGARQLPGVVLSTELMYLTDEQAQELMDGVKTLIRSYELEDPDQIPAGTRRMASLWSLVPDSK